MKSEDFNTIIASLNDSWQALAHAIHALRDDPSFSTSIALKTTQEKAEAAWGLAKALKEQVVGEPSKESNLLLSDFEGLRGLPIGQPVEAYVLPPISGESQVWAVSQQDARGSWKRGRLANVNMCVSFSDGTHCWVHPSNINSTYNGRCRIVDEVVDNEEKIQ